MVAPGHSPGYLSWAERPSAWDPRLFWSTLALAGALLVGALIIAWVDRWRKQPRRGTHNSGDQLSHFRTLYERGELSAEEYARIRALLTERLVKELESQAPAAPPPAPGPGPDRSGNKLLNGPPAPPPPETPPPGGPPA